MGLDIYLRKCDNLAKMRDLEAQYNKQSEALWDDGREYKSYSEAEKEEIHAKSKEIAVSLGLDEDGEYPKERIEIDSTKYPDHYFKVGYFRSSYNDGGINSVARRYNLPGLYDVFAVDDEYEFVPDWKASLERTKTAIQLWSETKSKYDCFSVDKGFIEPEISSEQEALACYAEQSDKKHGSSAYSNRNGHFYHDGIKVVGIIPGKGHFGDTTYIVYEREEGNDWYIQALEIVKETIEFVLNQPDQDKYYLTWSG